jgi:hypothetical protein
VEEKVLFPLGGLTVIAGESSGSAVLPGDVEELVPEKDRWALGLVF